MQGLSAVRPLGLSTKANHHQQQRRMPLQTLTRRTSNNSNQVAVVDAHAIDYDLFCLGWRPSAVGAPPLSLGGASDDREPLPPLLVSVAPNPQPETKTKNTRPPPPPPHATSEDLREALERTKAGGGCSTKATPKAQTKLGIARSPWEEGALLSVRDEDDDALLDMSRFSFSPKLLSAVVPTAVKDSSLQEESDDSDDEDEDDSSYCHEADDSDDEDSSTETFYGDDSLDGDSSFHERENGHEEEKQPVSILADYENYLEQQQKEVELFAGLLHEQSPREGLVVIVEEMEEEDESDDEEEGKYKDIYDDPGEELNEVKEYDHDQQEAFMEDSK
jgi:hypothetical protein